MPRKINKLIIFPLILSGFFLLPYLANAQSLSLTSDKSTYKVGEDIPVVLNLNTSDKLINVVDGTVNFSNEYFDVKDITTGKSLLTLWPKRPTVSGSGVIVFTGGIPHGFNGSDGNIFSFVLRPKKIGDQLISISSAVALLNDGLGTKVNGLALNPLKITIVKKNDKKDNEKSDSDHSSEIKIDTAALATAALLPLKIATPSLKINSSIQHNVVAKDKKNKKSNKKNAKKN